MTSCHKRLPEFALEARRRLAAHLRPAVCRLSTDEIRVALGDDPKNAGQLRRDVADIRSGRPDPRDVADLIDSGGMVFARERWGWLDQTTLSRLARAGRQAAGRQAPTGNHHRNSAERYIHYGWDELLADRLDVPAAAEVLGLSAATITRGNA